MSFIAKSLSAVGSRLFTTSTAPDGHKTLEASPEESDAGSPGSSHEHPHKHRAKHQHNPQVLSSPTSPVRHITSTASGLRRPSNRRRESKSDLADEKRLLGDYTTPADAVIITPPNATTFKKHKPITGGHRPMNTMAGPMISNIQVPPRAAQRTYGGKSSRAPVHELDDDPIFDGEMISPRKRRKTIHPSSNPAPFHVREDRHSPPASRRSQRPPEKPKHSRDTIWNDPLGKSEFLMVDDMINNYTSKRREPRTSLTSLEGKPGRPTAAPRTSGVPERIELSDDEESSRNHLSPPVQHVTDALSAALSPIGRRTAVPGETPERISPYFPPTNGAKVVRSLRGGAHNTHTDFKAFIHTDRQKSNSKQQRSPQQDLSRQFHRDNGSSDDELSIQPGKSSGHPRNVLENRPSKIPPTAAHSQAKQKQGQEAKSECRLTYFATHGTVLQDRDDVTFFYSREENCHYVRQLVSGSSNHKAVSRIDQSKAMRVVECAEMKSLRLTGSRSGLSTFWFDLQFEDEDEYVIFSQSMPQVGVTRVCKSRSEMTKILGKPLYPGVVPPEQDEEISLLEANQRRRADEPSHRLTMPESRLPRKRLSHGLQSTVVEDNAAKKPRIHVAESELNEGEMGSRPPVSHQRRTRRSLYTNSEDPFRDLSPARLDYGVLEKDRYSVNPGLGPKWEKPVEFPLVGRRRATVPYDDLEKLDDGQFLNDALLEFYMLWAYEQAKLPSGHVHLFNTYFYETLSQKQKGGGVNYKGVARWVKDDIFSYDYVVVPVNEDTHWYVAIICNLPNIEGVKMRETPGDALVKPEIIQVEDEDNREPSNAEIQPNGTASDHHGDCSRTNVYTPQDSNAPSALSEQEDPDLFAEEHATNSKTICETGEWPDPKENRESQSVTPFRDTSAAVQRLSLQDDPPGSNLDSPALKSNTGSLRGKKKWPGPRKYDPDQPVMIVLDSLDITHAKAVRNLKDYIQEEGKAKRKIDAQITSTINVKDIPKQSNYYDCGVFVLLYLKAFFQNPREFVTKILTREMSLENDWVGASAGDMRAEIRNILYDLHKEQDAVRKKQKAERKKIKKESPEKKVVEKEKKPEKSPEPQPAAKASSSPAKRQESPKVHLRNGENADLDDAPVPSIEDRPVTPSTPALPFRAQGLEGTPESPIGGRHTKFGSTIPESPPIPAQSSRLGSEAAPIEIEDSQVTMSQDLIQQQPHHAPEPTDLWAQLEVASGKEPSISSKEPRKSFKEPSISITSPRSGRKRRIVDVDRYPKTSFDEIVEDKDSTPADATRNNPRAHPEGD